MTTMNSLDGAIYSAFVTASYYLLAMALTILSCRVGFFYLFV